MGSIDGPNRLGGLRWILTADCASIFRFLQHVLQHVKKKSILPGYEDEALNACTPMGSLRNVRFGHHHGKGFLDCAGTSVICETISLILIEVAQPRQLMPVVCIGSAKRGDCSGAVFACITGITSLTIAGRSDRRPSMLLLPA